MSGGLLSSPLRPGGRQGHILAALPLLLAVLASSGCVTLYQPQRTVHGPVVIERSPKNFEGLRVLVRCHAHERHLPAGDARKLCGRIARDLEAQGAETEWVVPSRRGVEEVPFGGEGADLTVVIESRIDHERDYALSACCSACTCTILPVVSEQSFSQRVAVYGRDRSVLTEDILRERFVEYFGCGVYSLNWLLDWLVRDEDSHLSGEAPRKRFAEDFYGQIRQLAFNARVRAEVLGLLEPTSARPSSEAEGEAGSQRGAQGGAQRGAQGGSTESSPTAAPVSRTPGAVGF